MRLSPFALLDALIAPPPEAERTAFLAAQPYAHRGLHGSNIPENSRAAFSAAIAVGHGIELDVQAARDGEAFVFHDAELDRLTHQTGAFASLPAAVLEKVGLRNSDETIPRLPDILNHVASRVPILIEVKTVGDKVGVLCLSVRRALEGYQGDIAVMSFNPAVGRWFREHAPRFTRGLVVSESGPAGLVASLTRWAQRRIGMWRAQPDFLAYDVRDFPSRFATRQRKRGLIVLTWTVRTASDERSAFANADEIIYEKPDTGS
jgi:glycerophosphoryl diester phosphodiesterase